MNHTKRAYYFDSVEEAQDDTQETTMTDETIDQAHERLGHTAPRVTPADLENAIADIDYVKHVAKSGQVLRWCVLTLHNGFAVTGDPSASVSPENDSQELGEKFALENAKRALWPLLGIMLKDRLHNQKAAKEQHENGDGR